MTAFDNINPRYAAYCLEHNAVSAEEMLVRDRAEFPTACMLGFIVWSNMRLREAAKSHPEWFGYGGHGIIDHPRYNAWLIDQVRTAQFLAPAECRG